MNLNKRKLHGKNKNERISRLKSAASWLGRQPFYVLLVAPIPILNLYIKNNIEAYPSDTVLPLILVLMLQLLVIYILVIVLKRNKGKVALFLALFTLYFFYFGHLFDAYAPDLRGVFVFGQDMVKPRSWFNISVYLLIVIGLLIWRWKGFDKIEKPLRIMLNVMVSTIFLSSLYSFSSIALGHKEAYVFDVAKMDFPETMTAQKESEYSGDVYYLVFDRYANETTLNREFGYSNRDFLTQLEDQGFEIKNDAYSNYPFTSTSLASSLNMSYLDALGELEGKTSNQTPLFEMIENNKVTEQFKKLGYTTVLNASWWPATQEAKNYDIAFNKGVRLDFLKGEYLLPTFSHLLLQKSALHPILADGIEINDKTVLGLNDRQTHFNAFKYQVRKFEEMTKIDGKKFVFGHFLVPHPPYVFDEDGLDARPKNVKRTPQEQYRYQMEYANKEIQKFIDLILANSGEDSIIIIQADEGPYPDNYVKQGTAYDFEFAPTDDLRTKFGIIQAIRDGSGLLQMNNMNETTPVNIFRHLFNEAYNLNYSVLDDRHYAYKSSTDRYNFVDISKALLGD